MILRIFKKVGNPQGLPAFFARCLFQKRRCKAAAHPWEAKWRGKARKIHPDCLWRRLLACLRRLSAARNRKIISGRGVNLTALCAQLSLSRGKSRAFLRRRALEAAFCATSFLRTKMRICGRRAASFAREKAGLGAEGIAVLRRRASRLYLPEQKMKPAEYFTRTVPILWAEQGRRRMPDGRRARTEKGVFF